MFYLLTEEKRENAPYYIKKFIDGVLHKVLRKSYQKREETEKGL